MKNKLQGALFFVLVALFSCKDDDEGPSYNFKDQDVTGKISNVSWSYQDGYASIEDSDGVEMISVNLLEDEEGEGCSISFPEGNQVIFSLPNAVGLYKLKLNLTSPEESYVASFFDMNEFTLYIAVKGAIEIISISDTEVSGRIDARVDGKNFVNGNFTVSICQ